VSVIPSGIFSRRSFERNIAQPLAAALATWIASGSLSPSSGPTRIARSTGTTESQTLS
jgi:hypothetical protein